MPIGGCCHHPKATPAYGADPVGFWRAPGDPGRELGEPGLGRIGKSRQGSGALDAARVHRIFIVRTRQGVQLAVKVGRPSGGVGRCRLAFESP